ncbi:MAG TPA: putative sugar nucleotidyl transferase [Ignavibacteriales bacterium]|nr:putative sugar nucleotidyl transferase [Ignavibacteriales bacterium]HOL80496.1 putative sugar nucleotidyl transferase [Ignavibacteriales bacterium]HPD67968.1 putative sugar nucleotidyl transferase [Ignavibacteriales bacterium]HPP34223.1 putative sugar nucleotidyl transferase [Ignavibacteriales bacterium]HRR19336.1 putative sugar nucleotidyl transferase [Ignavibacteriales bacterium]
MQVCIYEDIHYENLEPLIFVRPVYDLICGMSTLKDKILRHFPQNKFSLHTRTYLAGYLKLVNKVPVNEIIDNDVLFINGRVLADSNFLNEIDINHKEPIIYKNKDTIVAARLNGEYLNKFLPKLNDLISDQDFLGINNIKVENVDVKTINYIWDLIHYHHDMMIEDYQVLFSKIENRFDGKIFDGVHIVEKENVLIKSGTIIKPGVVLDASKGPIVIENNVQIFPNAVIEGPAFIGENSQIKAQAYIYDNVYAGKVCKLGGEVEYSIFYPYTNKQHAGFIGHAYIGSWVNLGADTNCSDLKNNYGFVRMYVNGEAIVTNQQFLGVVIGDHTKVAINTMFNTGTVVGFSSNIFGAGFPSKSLPSFTWGGCGTSTTYDLERAIETAKRVMARRNYIMSEEEENIFRKTFDITKKARKRNGYPY